MLIYSLIILMLFFGFFHFDVREKKAGKAFYYFLTFCSMVLMLGFRYRVGGDSLAYEDTYPLLPTFKEIFRYGLYSDDRLFSYQPLWLFLVAFCKSIGKEYYVFQLVHAFLINLMLFVYLKKNTTKPFTVLLFLFVTHFYFYFTVEIQREVLAIGVFLFNIKNLQNKKWLNFYLLATVSFLFHISAFFLFFLPLLRIFNIKSKKVVIITLMLTPLIFFQSIILDVLEPFLFLDVMQSKMETYSEIEFSLLGTIYFLLARVIFLLPILLYFYKTKDDEEYWLYTSYIFIAVLSLSLVGFERLLNYLLIPLVISCVHFTYNMKSVRQVFINRYVVFALTFIHLFSNIPIRLFTTNDKGERYLSLFFPYVSIFDKKVIHERENYIINQWDL